MTRQTRSSVNPPQKGVIDLPIEKLPTQIKTAANSDKYEDQIPHNIRKLIGNKPELRK